MCYNRYKYTYTNTEAIHSLTAVLWVADTVSWNKAKKQASPLLLSLCTGVERAGLVLGVHLEHGRSQPRELLTSMCPPADLGETRPGLLDLHGQEAELRAHGAAEHGGSPESGGGRGVEKDDGQSIALRWPAAAARRRERRQLASRAAANKKQEVPSYFSAQKLFCFIFVFGQRLLQTFLALQKCPTIRPCSVP